VIALVVATVLIAVLDAGDGNQAGPGKNVAGQANGGHEISAPLEGRQTAEFDLVSGTTSVTVHSADLGDKLYQVTTPADGPTLPKTLNQGTAIKLFLTGSGQDGPAAVDVQLNSRVLWKLRITGGAAEHTIDMSAGRLGSLDVAGGATLLEVTLPPPEGTVAVRSSGGANQFVVHAPANVPARVTISGGAGSATIDGAVHNGIASGTVFTPKDWDSSPDRYDVNAVTGVGTLILDRG
jgi:hypothetical protein